MVYGIARWSFVTVTLLLIGPAALAQTDNSIPGQPPTATQPVPWGRGTNFRMECSQDLRRFCDGVQPGEGRLIRCLSSHSTELSPACISRLAAARPGLSMDCGQDLQRFCNGVQPGEGRLIGCLSSHRSDLSAACLSRLAAVRPALGVIPPSENPLSPGLPSASPPADHAVTKSALRASCGPDAQKLCGGVLRENGRVIKCLSSHRMELSPPCDAFFNEMRMRQAAPRGTPKTTSPTAKGPADNSAPSAANGPTAMPAGTNGAAITAAPSAANGPAAAPANGAADTGAPPAAASPAATSAPPGANSQPAKGALAFPL